MTKRARSTPRSYLLRLWQVDDYGKTQTRITLVEAHSGARVSFVSLDDLVQFLRQTEAQNCVSRSSS